MGELKQQVNIENILEAAMRIPGVKVSRDEFLTNIFADRKSSEQLAEIIEKGPYHAGVQKKEWLHYDTKNIDPGHCVLSNGAFWFTVDGESHRYRTWRTVGRRVVSTESLY